MQDFFHQQYVGLFPSDSPVSAKLWTEPVSAKLWTEPFSRWRFREYYIDTWRCLYYLLRWHVYKSCVSWTNEDTSNSLQETRLSPNHLSIVHRKDTVAVPFIISLRWHLYPAALARQKYALRLLTGWLLPLLLLSFVWCQDCLATLPAAQNDIMGRCFGFLQWGYILYID